VLELLRDLPVAQMATVACAAIVGTTRVGTISVRPFFDGAPKKREIN
jgi:hypothetical protein